jgi:hypothetical protein
MSEVLRDVRNLVTPEFRERRQSIGPFVAAHGKQTCLSTVASIRMLSALGFTLQLTSSPFEVVKP